eukprot:scaffold123421_cov63-Phaeocystis_antarctica.AAC.2
MALSNSAMAPNASSGSVLPLSWRSNGAANRKQPTTPLSGLRTSWHAMAKKSCSTCFWTLERRVCSSASRRSRRAICSLRWLRMSAASSAPPKVTPAVMQKAVMMFSCRSPIVDMDGRTQQPRKKTAALASRCDHCSAEKPAKEWYRKIMRREVRKSEVVAPPLPTAGLKHIPR